MSDWRDSAACRGEPVDLFFPIGRGGNTNAALRTIRPLCAGCPVRDDCLDHAVRHELFGLWAATSERQRKQMRRRLGIIIACPTAAIRPGEMSLRMRAKKAS